MKKFDVLEEGEAVGQFITLNTLEDLKKLLGTLDIHAEAELRYQNLYIVKHMRNVGGSQYIANASQNFDLLKHLSEKIEAKEAFVTYYIRLTGQRVAI